MYEDVTYSVLLERMLERAASFDPNIDTREGSMVWLGNAPAAMELQNLYIALDNLLTETFADTASREYLIRRAAERGLSPYPATAAVLQLQIEPTELTLDMNTRFSIGVLNYTVTGELGEGAYEVTCETAGTAGNDYSGTVIPIDNVDGLTSCTITALLIPGEDEEDTEDFRERYFETLNNQGYGGNQADYIAEVSAIQGVGGVKVYPSWEGNIAPSSVVPSSAVTAWKNSLTGLSSEVKTWLDNVYNATLNGYLTPGGTVGIVIIDSTFGVPSTTLVESVQTQLDPEGNAGEGVGIAPIGHVVKVSGVTSTEVALTFEGISYQKGWAWEDVESAVSDAMSAYFLELAKSWADNEGALVVRVSQVESRLLDVEGILDVGSAYINSQNANYTLPENSIPVLKSVGLTTV